MVKDRLISSTALPGEPLPNLSASISARAAWQSFPAVFRSAYGRTRTETRWHWVTYYDEDGDPYQVYEARAFGASAMLLIAAVLDVHQAEDLAGLAKELGLEVLMELHGEDEFGYMVDGVTVAGINNRNLKTFEVDLEHSIRMANMLPAQLPKISESGIRTIDDMKKLRAEGGFDGFLIGENFMKEEHPGKACIEFCQRYSY